MQSPLVSLLRTRLLIGYLGEKAQFGWWPTAFYEASGRLFLEPIFAKTPHLAQYHGVLEAACRVHDEHLNVGTYHLFRLPEELEQDLHGLVLTGSEQLSPAIAYGDKQAALDALAASIGSAKRDGTGPVHVGNLTDISDRLNEIASIYHSAFVTGARSFPYLVS